MALHKDFPQSPHAILDPALRWFPADEALRQTRPFVAKDRGYLIPKKSVFNRIIGDISNYYPDFLVKVPAKRIIIVETKCQEDLWQGAAPDRNSSAIDSDR